MRVIDMLICASATAAEIGAWRVDSMRRADSNFDNFRFCELPFLTRDFRGHAFAVDCQRNKDRLAMLASDALTAESDVSDL